VRKSSNSSDNSNALTPRSDQLEGTPLRESDLFFDEVLTTAGAARLLHRTRETLGRWRTAGSGPHKAPPKVSKESSRDEIE
jgi:hypothetical protein